MRGVIGVQFNWIFILIIGGMILAGFFAVINQQNKQSSLELAVELRQNLNLVLETVTSQDLYEKELRLPLRTNFFCYGNDTAFYEIEETGITQNTHLTPFFTPEHLGPGLVLARAESWKRPISISKFLFMTDKLHHYIFINTGADVVKLYNLLPDSVNKELVSPEEYLKGILGISHHYYTTIIVGIAPDILPTPIDTNNAGVIVSFEPEGVVRFASHFGPQVLSAATDSWERLAAIYTSDGNRYSCERTKAVFNAGQAYTLAQHRTDKLGTIYANEENPNFNVLCAAKYSVMTEDLEILRESLKVMTPDTVSISNAINNLNRVNTDLVRSNCAPIY